MPEDSQESIDDAALAWFVLLRDDDATKADRAAFAAWRAADRRHQAAWDAMETLWAGLDTVVPGRPDAAGRVVDLRRSPSAAPHAVTRRGFWGGAAAAGLVLAVGGSTWVAASRGAFADYRTGIGEQRSLTLPDGSSVVLGAASALSVDFAPERRAVVLERGEGYFSLTPDPARPFTVRAGSGTATVLGATVGTILEARLGGGIAGFAAATGGITVDDRTGNQIAVAPGERVDVTDRGLGPATAIDLADIAAWRAGRIVFRDASLGAVIDDLQRYLPAHIFVVDSTLHDIAVTGVFDAARADAALDTIAQTLPIRLARLGDLLILVSRAG